MAALPLTLGTLLPAPAQAATATTVSASISDSTVTVGGTSTVSGTVSGATGRTTRLQVRLDNGWRTLRTTTTDGSRRYSFSAPTRWLNSHTLRVVAPAAGSSASGASSSRALTVNPSWTPAGRSGDWSPLHSSRPRFNPCMAITWKFNQNGGYSSSLTDLKGAFRRLAQATGLTFSYQGTTTVVPKSTTHDTSVALTVGFASPTQVGALRGSVAGQGGAMWTNHDGTAEIIRGSLVLDRTEKLRPGFATSGNPDWGQVMQHELGHALGLGHASGSNQLLYGVASSSNHRLGAGDLAGLRTVGLQPGCIPNAVRRV
jgi:Matrixin